jgi:hypothetical protein
MLAACNDEHSALQSSLEQRPGWQESFGPSAKLVVWISKMGL